MGRSTSEHGRQALIDAQAPTILALETATNACSVALCVGGTLFEDHRVAPRQHDRIVLAMIDELMRAAQLEPADLDAVAFGCGPGSFTGVRIAAGVAQGICLGVGIPVVPVSTLRVLAQTAATALPAARDLLATIHARTDALYYGGYRSIDGICSALIADAMVRTSELVLPPAVDSKWHLVGDGAGRFADLLAQQQLSCVIDAAVLPTASALLILARTELQLGRGVDAARALPVYLDGTGPWRKRGE